MELQEVPSVVPPQPEPGGVGVASKGVDGPGRTGKGLVQQLGARSTGSQDASSWRKNTLWAEIWSRLTSLRTTVKDRYEKVAVPGSEYADGYSEMLGLNIAGKNVTSIKAQSWFVCFVYVVVPAA